MNEEEKKARLQRVQALDHISPAMWTAEDALLHLEWTFDEALKHHPDAMERYLPRLYSARNETERIAIMRYALAATVGERYQ